MYEHANGTTTLRSRATPGGSTNARRPRYSEDGSHVFFETFARVTPSDTDNWLDVYENVNGAIRLVSTGPAGPCPAAAAPCEATLQAITPDGTHAVFITDEQLVPEDSDSCRDTYERVDDAITRLVTTGPADGSECSNLWVPYISDDGERIVFPHDASLVAEDRDQDKCVISDRGRNLSGRLHRRVRAPRRRDDAAVHRPIRRSGRISRHLRGDVGRRLGRRPRHGRGSLALRLERVRRHVHTAACHGLPASGGRVPAEGVPGSRLPAVHCAESHARPAARSPVLRSTLARIATSDGRVGDGNPATARSIGFIRMVVVPGVPGGPDDTDVRLRMSLTNVMHASDLTDYTGELRGSMDLRVTDRDNGPSAGDAATVVDFPFRFTCRASQQPARSTALRPGDDRRRRVSRHRERG